MKSSELRKVLRQSFPTLKKPFFGRDPITLLSPDYPDSTNENIYFDIYKKAWDYVDSLGIEYHEGFPECENYVNMILGKFTEIWYSWILNGLIPKGMAPRIGAVSGLNLNGEMHRFQIIIPDKIYICDYGEIKATDGYKPYIFIM